MKCLVCGKLYEGSACPRCLFPKVVFPGDYKESVKKMKPTIDAFRADFLEHKVFVEVVAWSWRDEGGTLAEVGQLKLPVGSGTDLQRKIRLEEKFARIPEMPTLPVRLTIRTGQESREEEIALPNLDEPGLQTLGVFLDEDLILHLTLSGESGAETVSDSVPLLV